MEEKNEKNENNEIKEEIRNVENVKQEEKTKTVKSKTKMKKKTKVIIGIIVAIVAVILIGISILFAYHKKQLEILNEEGKKILSIQVTDLSGNINENANIDMDIKTTGGYAVVEETLKNYINEVITLSKQADEIYEEENIENILSIENIKEDGPDFTKTKENVNTMKQNAEDYLNKFIELLDEQKILARIDDKPVNQYYKQIYIALATDNKTSSEFKEVKTQMEETKENLNNAFNKITEVVQFLSDNKDSWAVQGNRIMFNNQQKLNEFNQKVNELSNI